MSQEETNTQATLEALNQELDSLLYTISHDVRAPLRALDGFSTALEEDYSDVLDDLGRDYLMRIRRAVSTADQYMQGLLAVSRATRGEMDLQPTNLSRELFAINHELRQKYAPRTVEVDIQSDVRAMVDMRLVRTLLVALLDNAWKFTSSEEQPSIRFGTAQTEHGTACYIADNGIGFDMDRAKKGLFGMFQHLHHEHDQQGLGTGLAMARRIVSRHMGVIWAQAEPDKGATFYFTLPVTPAADAETGMNVS